MGSPSEPEEDPARRLYDLEAMLEAVADRLIAKVDPEGRVTAWGGGATAQTGYTPEEVIGRSLSLLHDQQERLAGLLEQELRSALEQGRVEQEIWHVRKSGERYLARVALHPAYDEAGELTGFVEVAHDVTKSHGAEPTFHDLLESAPDAMIILGYDRRISTVNHRTEELFGYTADELLGQEVEILVPHRFRDLHPGLRASYYSQPKARDMASGLELFALRRDGSEFPAEISLSPIETDQGILVSAVIRDVTNHRRQIEQLRLQRDEILELSTPVIEVWDKVLALPIIGTLDSSRAALLTEGLLERISEDQAEVVILDVSGVPAIDTLVAQHLLKTVQAATLMGATSIMSGIRPETAQAMVHLGIDLGHLLSRNTLRDALRLALQIVRERSGSSSGLTLGTKALEEPS